MNQKRLHPEKGDSPSRDRRANNGDAVEKIADAGYRAFVLIHCAKHAHRRTVVHAGFAAVQGDIVCLLFLTENAEKN